MIVFETTRYTVHPFSAILHTAGLDDKPSSAASGASTSQPESLFCLAEEERVS
jgi:hypothetical protein